MSLKNKLLHLLLVFFPPFVASSQGSQAMHNVNIEVPEVALLGLVSDGSANISPYTVSPFEAGSYVSFSGMGQRAEAWVNYSSIVGSNSRLRKVEATIRGDIPKDARLLVEASAVSGEGKGRLGSSAGLVELSGQPAEIISGIGSCYTGKGANNGHLLSYKLEFDDPGGNVSLLAQNEITFNVVFILSASD